MSVYRDTNTSVVFEHPHAGPLTATVYREGVTDPILTGTSVTKSGDRFTLSLDYTHTASDGKLTVVWTAAGFERKQYVDVVTPLLARSQLRQLWLKDGQVPPADGDIDVLEKTVRTIIEAYTGQGFGCFVGTKTFIGTGSKVILLEQRLATLVDFYGAYGSQPITGLLGDNLERVRTANRSLVKASADGWRLFVNHKRTLTNKEPGPGDEVWTYSGDVIRVPDYYLRCFDSGATYTVTGTWGYENVPDAVQEAAMLLANDYVCNESLYHDRYLESVKIQQDTITYAPGAYRGTGNSRVDLLLERYKKPGLVII